MAFFRNNAVNLLNIHYWVLSIALYGGGAFFVVYLLKAGVTTPMVLVSMALITILRFAIRPAVVPLAARFGLRTMVIAGTLLSALQYLFLADVHGAGPVLFGLIMVAAIGDTVYWSSYHAYFARLGDDEHRGSQIGVREAISALVGIVSPILTGWLLVRFGPRVAFYATSVVVVLATYPILRTPDFPVPQHVEGAYRAALQGTLLFVADGWIASGQVFVWQIALFLSLGESYVAFGGALAAAALVGAIGGLFLGRIIDAGNGRAALWAVFAVFSAIIVLRAIATGDAALAVAANALGTLGTCLYIPAMMTVVYKQSKRSPCVLRFSVATEGGWDIGCSIGCLVAAGLIGLGVPLSWVISLSLIGSAAVFVALRRYYAENPGVVIEAIQDSAVHL